MTLFNAQTQDTDAVQLGVYVVELKDGTAYEVEADSYGDADGCVTFQIEDELVAEFCRADVKIISSKSGGHLRKIAA